MTFCFRGGLSATFEFFGKGNVVEEGPWVVEFVVPCRFELAHGGDQGVEFFVADEGEEAGIYAC